MIIKQFLTPYMRSFSYVILENRAAIIVDPCELDRVKMFLRNEVDHIELCILTHEHYDHISGLDWMHKSGVPVLASAKCEENLKSTKLNQSRYFRVFCELQERLKGDDIPEVNEYIGFVDRTFEGFTSFQWEGHDFYLRETPGHSNGSICILIDQKYLLSGDTLFSTLDTNTNILGGSQTDLDNISMPWLRSLDRDTIVYPGHYDIFRLKDRFGR